MTARLGREETPLQPTEGSAGPTGAGRWSSPHSCPGWGERAVQEGAQPRVRGCAAEVDPREGGQLRASSCHHHSSWGSQSCRVERELRPQPGSRRLLPEGTGQDRRAGKQRQENLQSSEQVQRPWGSLADLGEKRDSAERGGGRCPGGSQRQARQGLTGCQRNAAPVSKVLGSHCSF